MSFTADAVHTKSAFRGMSNYVGRVRSADIAGLDNIGYESVERRASVDDGDADKAEVPGA
jgi:hypothetical protein